MLRSLRRERENLSRPSPSGPGLPASATFAASGRIAAALGAAAEASQAGQGEVAAQGAPGGGLKLSGADDEVAAAERRRQADAHTAPPAEPSYPCICRVGCGRAARCQSGATDFDICCHERGGCVSGNCSFGGLEPGDPAEEDPRDPAPIIGVDECCRHFPPPPEPLAGRSRPGSSLMKPLRQSNIRDHAAMSGDARPPRSHSRPSLLLAAAPLRALFPGVWLLGARGGDRSSRRPRVRAAARRAAVTSTSSVPASSSSTGSTPPAPPPSSSSSSRVMASRRRSPAGGAA